MVSICSKLLNNGLLKETLTMDVDTEIVYLDCSLIGGRGNFWKYVIG